MKLQAELFQEELIKENIGLPEDPLKLIDKYAMEIFYMDPPTQQKYLDEMATTMPITYRLVLDRLNMYQTEMYNMPVVREQMENPVAAQEAEMEKEVNKATIKEEASERKSRSIKKEKTKGQTRGSV